MQVFVLLILVTISIDMPTKKAEVDTNIGIQQKLRIKISAYDHKVIDTSCKQIMETVLRQGCEVVGPVPLPTEIHKYTVNRSSFIHKNAREQFEMRVHKRLIDILEPTQQTIDDLGKLELSAGIDVEIKLQ